MSLKKENILVFRNQGLPILSYFMSASSAPMSLPFMVYHFNAWVPQLNMHKTGDPKIIPIQ